MNRPRILRDVTWKHAVAATIAATVLGLVGGTEVADAHDFHIEVTTPQCVNGHKEADAHVFNDWTTDMTFTSAFLSGSPVKVKPGAYGVIHSAVPGNTTGDSYVDTVTGKWADNVSMTHTYKIKWGSGICEGAPPTTVPPTTPTTICQPGQVYNSPIGSPGQCVPAPTTVATAPPVTNAAPTTVPVVESTPPISTPEGLNTPTSMVRPAPPRSTPPAALPATGAGDVLKWIALFAVALVLVGGIGAFAIHSDRQKATKKAREDGASIVLGGPEWPQAEKRAKTDV